MAVSHQGVYVQTPGAGVAQLLNADGTTKKTLVTGAANGTKVTGINVTSTDTANRILGICITRAAVSYNIAGLLIPLGSGTDAAGLLPSINPLVNCPGLPVDNDGQRYIFLASGDTLQVFVQTAVTAAKQIDCVAVYGDF